MNQNEPIDILVDDLGRQIAQKALEAAEWKTRAIVAEQQLQQLAEQAEAAQAEIEGQTSLEVVPEEGDG